MKEDAYSTAIAIAFSGLSIRSIMSSRASFLNKRSSSAIVAYIANGSGARFKHFSALNSFRSGSRITDPAQVIPTLGECDSEGDSESGANLIQHGERGDSPCQFRSDRILIRCSCAQSPARQRMGRRRGAYWLWPRSTTGRVAQRLRKSAG